jgi:glycosyltransferase involved in cell wall biosynthesis
MLKRLPGVLVASDFMRGYLENDGVAPERIHVTDITMGIAPEKEPSPILTDAPLDLLFVGRVTQYKGLQFAVDALRLLGGNFRLTVVGDGWYLPQVKKQVAKLGLDSQVQFTGFLRGAELQQRYASAGAVLVPSVWPEPAGLVVPEARALGQRVIAFDRGGIGGWASQYGLDYLYLAKEITPEALADTIRAVATGKAQPALRRTLPRPLDFVEALQKVIQP